MGIRSSVIAGTGMKASLMRRAVSSSFEPTAKTLAPLARTSSTSEAERTKDSATMSTVWRRAQRRSCLSFSVIAGTDTATPGYTLVDLSAGATPVRHVELRVLVRNAFDQEYFASQDVRAVFAPGRAASLTAVLRF